MPPAPGWCGAPAPGAGCRARRGPRAPHAGCRACPAGRGLAAPDPGDDVADLLEETDSGFGRIRALRHAAILPETPAHWARPTVPLGTHKPAWP
ncbi:protein of unknown function [Rhodovastum atsumiense]|nr:protein of unknown function [Rhodovastum atsumiense]